MNLRHHQGAPWSSNLARHFHRALKSKSMFGWDPKKSSKRTTRSVVSNVMHVCKSPVAVSHLAWRSESYLLDVNERNPRLGR